MTVIFRVYIYTHRIGYRQKESEKKNQIAPRTGGGLIRPTRLAAVLIPPAGARLGAANNGRANENNVDYVDCSTLFQWFVSQ